MSARKAPQDHGSHVDEKIETPSVEESPEVDVATDVSDEAKQDLDEGKADETEKADDKKPAVDPDENKDLLTPKPRARKLSEPVAEGRAVGLQR